MALPHARSGELIDLRPLGAALEAKRTHALIKSGQLELIRLVLRAGEALPPHRVAGEITIHCLEGRVEVPLEGGRKLALEAGQLVHLAGDADHAVRALDDASVLVTIVL